MMKKALTALVIWAAFGGVAQAEDRDPFAGTWTLNPAKSVMSPITASKSETVTYKHVNGEEIYTSDAVTAKGEAEHTDYRGVYDGPNGTLKETIDGAVSAEGPLQLRKLDGRTRLRNLLRSDGSLTGIIVRRLSEDGKTITSSILAFEPDGKIAVRSVRVFEKQDDIFNGTWKLNIAKSTMQPETASRSEIVYYEIVGNEERFRTEAVTAKGEPEALNYAAKYDDGKAYPFTTMLDGKVTNAQTMVRKIDEWTRERYNVRDGKPVIGSRRVVSKDGRTMTITTLRVDAQGKEVVNSVRIFDKQ